MVGGIYRVGGLRVSCVSISVLMCSGVVSGRGMADDCEIV